MIAAPIPMNFAVIMIMVIRLFCQSALQIRLAQEFSRLNLIWLSLSGSSVQEVRIEGVIEDLLETKMPLSSVNR